MASNDLGTSTVAQHAAQEPILPLQGTGTISDLVAGLDWVASNAKQPAVATLSLGVPVGQVSP